MPHHVALTVINGILPLKTDEVEETLGSIHENRRREAVIPFNKSPTLHFARFFTHYESTGLKRRPTVPETGLPSRYQCFLGPAYRGPGRRGQRGSRQDLQFSPGLPARGPSL